MSHPPSLPSATPQTAAAFRSVSVKLLSRLVADERKKTSKKHDTPGIVISLGGTGRDAMYTRMSRLIRDADEDQLPVAADVIIHVVGGEFDDRIEYLGYASGEGTHFFEWFALWEIPC